MADFKQTAGTWKAPYEQNWSKLYQDKLKYLSNQGPMSMRWMDAPVEALTSGGQALAGTLGNALSAMISTNTDNRTASEKGTDMANYIQDRVGSGIGSSQGSTRVGVATPSGVAPFWSFNFSGDNTNKSLPLPEKLKPKAPLNISKSQDTPLKKVAAIPQAIAPSTAQTVVPTQKSLMPTLPEDNPIYREMALKDYNMRKNSVGEIINPAKSKQLELIKELENYSGGPMGEALALSLLFGNALPSFYKTAGEHAGEIGRMSPEQLQATRLGLGVREDAQRQEYKELLPSTKAALSLHKAQIKHAEAGVRSNEQQEKLHGAQANAWLRAIEGDPKALAALGHAPKAQSDKLDMSIVSGLSPEAIKAQIIHADMIGDTATATALAQYLKSQKK